MLLGDPIDDPQYGLMEPGISLINQINPPLIMSFGSTPHSALEAGTLELFQSLIGGDTEWQ
jgi:hypothetical protein